MTFHFAGMEVTLSETLLSAIAVAGFWAVWYAAKADGRLKSLANSFAKHVKDSDVEHKQINTTLDDHEVRLVRLEK
jgi:hypothetical protein